MKQKNSLLIQTLSILGGLLSAVFFIFFLLITMTQSEISCVVTSIILLITSIIINRLYSKPFLDAIHVTFYIAACTLPITYTSFQPDVLLIALIVISILTFFLTKGVLLPFMAVLSFNLFLFLEISNVLSYDDVPQIAAAFFVVIFILLHLFEDKLLSNIPDKYLKYKPLHAGVFVSAFIALVILSVLNAYSEVIISPSIYLLICLCFIIAVQQVIKAMKIKKTSTQCCIYLISIALYCPALYAPYLGGSLVLILLTYNYGYKKEFIASILLLAYSVSKFYYDLSLTLLTKSIILFFSGIACLAVWYYLTQKKAAHEKI